MLGYMPRQLRHAEGAAAIIGCRATFIAAVLRVAVDMLEARLLPPLA